MPLYKCELCNVLTNLKSNYIRHLKTKKHVTNLKENTCKLSDSEKVYTKYTQSIHKYTQSIHKIQHLCDLCDKGFSSKQSMYRHKRLYCKIGKENNYCINELKSMIHEQKQHINKLIDKVGTTNITTNNIQNNIQLNNYGKEDISYITDSMKSNLLKGPYNMIPKLIEHVHFNDNKPENQNILFPNKKENKIKIFKDNKWVYKDKQEVIDDLIDGKYFILDCHYENVLKDKFNKYNKKIYETFRELFDEKDITLHEQLKKECELMLLNNR
jgi:hypothetical protein